MVVNKNGIKSDIFKNVLARNMIKIDEEKEYEKKKNETLEKLRK